MSNITNLVKPPAMPADFSGILRKLADDIDAGRVTEMIVAYVRDGGYEFLWPSSLLDSLTLATLAQANAVDRLRR